MGLDNKGMHRREEFGGEPPDSGIRGETKP